MNQNLSIFIDCLTMDASVGVFDFEKKARQKLYVSLKARVAIPLEKDLQHSDVVCYDTVAKGIKSIVESQHHELLETLAQKIAVYCLADIRIKSVDLKLEKPDIIESAQSVGVRLEASQT